VPASEGYKGPLVVFSPEELRRIRALAQDQADTGNATSAEFSIIRKIDVSLNADPKWRTAASPQEEAKARQMS
jgi:hypothetical protein